VRVISKKHFEKNSNQNSKPNSKTSSRKESYKAKNPSLDLDNTKENPASL
jgi:hypothetical protein